MFSTLGTNSNRQPIIKSQSSEDRYAFLVEFFDTQADLTRQYQLLYYIVDKSIEMYDLKSKRIFLKRIPIATVFLDHLYVGASVNIHSRMYKVVDYGDDFTRKYFAPFVQKTFAMIKPNAFEDMGKIIDIISQSELKISKLKIVKLTKADAERFYSVHKDRPFFRDLVSFMTSGKVVAMELTGPNAVAKWRELLGPTNTAQARQTHPNSIRARFGVDNTKNAAHGSDSVENGQIESSFFFDGTNQFDTLASFHDSTICIIKPHSLQTGDAGKIIDFILEEGFEISCMQMFHLSQTDANEFLEVYKTVVPEYTDMVTELASGNCLAMEVRGEGANTVEKFRQICGPMDPEIAKHVRPNTIRAKFGQNKIKNAVHCTDLEEDGQLEVEYFFHLLQDQ